MNSFRNSYKFHKRGRILFYCTIASQNSNWQIELFFHLDIKTRENNYERSFTKKSQVTLEQLSTNVIKYLSRRNIVLLHRPRHHHYQYKLDSNIFYYLQASMSYDGACLIDTTYVLRKINDPNLKEVSSRSLVIDEAKRQWT